MARSRPHTPALVRDAAVVARPFARATRATCATFARAMASDGAGEAPRKLPKLTFKLKLSAAATARRDDGEDARRGKRRREDDETSEDDRRMRELKMKAARLSRMLPNGEVAGTRGGADGGDERDGSERVIERAAPSGAPSGLSRGTAPRAAIFDHVGFREGGTEAAPSTSSPDEDGVAGPEEPRVGGQNLTLEPPKVKNEGAVTKRKLEDALNKLQKLDKFHIFAYPVTEDIAPGYFSIISRPMDFATLRAHVKNNDYLSMYPFCVDVETMYRNALAYNPPSTEIHQQATMMLERARRMLNKLRGLSPNAGFIKPQKPKTIKATLNRAPLTAKLSKSANSSGALLATDVDMFSSGAGGLPDFPNDESVGVNDFSLVDEDNFGIGLDTFLDDDSFPMMGMQVDIADTFDMQEDDIATGDTVFVNPPQQIRPKTMAAATKRQTFKIPPQSRRLKRLPEIFMRPGQFISRLRQSGNIFVSSKSSATLDMYSASVRAFLSGVPEDARDKFLNERWKLCLARPDPKMVEPAKHAPTPKAPTHTGHSQLPSSTSQQYFPKPASASQLMPSVSSAASLETLLKENPDDQNHSKRVQSGLDGMRAMLRAGEALRGDPVPSNENPLDSLPRGFVPADGTMEFAVSCLGSTIAKTLKKFNVDLYPESSNREHE